MIGIPISFILARSHSFEDGPFPITKQVLVFLGVWIEAGRGWLLIDCIGLI